MKAEKWMILGALAGLTAVAINKQLRIQRHRMAEQQPESDERSSIDDVPTVQPTEEGASGSVEALDERVAPAAPF